MSIVPAGIASTELFGAATVTRGPVTATPTGIPSDEVFGAVSWGGAIAPAGIASAEAIGLAKIVCTVSPAGIASTEAVGVPNIGRGPVTVTPAGIASLEAFGAAKVTFGPVTASGIASGEAFGTPRPSRRTFGNERVVRQRLRHHFGAELEPGVYLPAARPIRIQSAVFGPASTTAESPARHSFPRTALSFPPRPVRRPVRTEARCCASVLTLRTAMTKVISLTVRLSKVPTPSRMNCAELVLACSPMPMHLQRQRRTIFGGSWKKVDRTTYTPDTKTGQ